MMGANQEVTSLFFLKCPDSDMVELTLLGFVGLCDFQALYNSGAIKAVKKNRLALGAGCCLASSVGVVRSALVRSG